MEEDITQKRSLGFWYFDDSTSINYKEKVKEYLSQEARNIEKIGFGHILVDLYDMDKIQNKRPTGHIFIIDLEDKENKFEEACNYILSKNREFIPNQVKCKNEKDYSMIEKIIKENYGGDGKLKDYFWRYGREIKIENHRKQ